ncbi:MAG: carboxymuconolactone decarboxylase family protein [Ferrovibrio sp.]
MTRLAPLSQPYPAEAAAELAQMPADIALFRTVAHNPRVLSRWRGGGLLDRGSISLRQREILILRTTAMLGAEYEWSVHVAFFAAKAGFTAAEIASTVRGTAADWNDDEAMLVRLAGTLVHAATIDDALWKDALAYFSPAQMIEIIALVGFYHMVSFTVNATGVALEPGAPRFPAA